MANDVVNLEAFKNKGPSQAFQVLDPREENLSDGIGQSYGVIQYKGKVWTLRYRGDKKTFLRKDDGSPSSYIDVVILQQARSKSKSYYAAYDPSGSSEGQAPICASIDGVKPDPGVTQKQAEACAICPRNQFKTLANGRKGKECQDYKRLAVFLLPVLTKQMFGETLREPVFLRVPPASLNNLALMGEQMAGQGYHFSSYITRVSFDPNEPHPKMVFKAIQPLTDTEAPVIFALREDPQSLRIIGNDDNRLAITYQGAVSQEQEAPTRETVAGSEARTVPPEQVDTGLGDMVSSPIQSTQAGSDNATDMSVSDTGEPTEADDELDARIARIMETPK